MKPIKMPHTTRTLGAPEDWDEKKLGPCVGLPITASSGVLFSYWQPTWKERLLVLTGRPIRLSVAGCSHPPVMLDTQP